MFWKEGYYGDGWLQNWENGRKYHKSTVSYILQGNGNKDFFVIAHQYDPEKSSNWEVQIVWLRMNDSMLILDP